MTLESIYIDENIMDIKVQTGFNQLMWVLLLTSADITDLIFDDDFRQTSHN